MSLIRDRIVAKLDALTALLETLKIQIA